GALLREDGETALQREHREQPHRAPAARAPRDRGQHGDRGPPRRGDRLLQRREARVQRALNRAVGTAVSAVKSPSLTSHQGKDPMKKAAALLVLVLASVALVACGSSSSNTTETEESGGGSAGAAEKPAENEESGGGEGGGAIVKIAAAEGT